MPDANSSPIRSSGPFSTCSAEETGTAQNTGPTCNNGYTPNESGNGENGENIDISNTQDSKKNSRSSKKETENNVIMVRRERPSRACTVRSAKLYVDPPVIRRHPRPPKREKTMAVEADEAQEDEDQEGLNGPHGKFITPLVNPPSPGQMSRWNMRAMWELASILNFLNVFRDVLKITTEFSAEELESALITPNNTLGDIHIPLLKAIPPVTRMACGRETWVTVLCRKLRDWWPWVADGEVPVVTAQGDELDHYKSLEPSVRVVILKALCDIRVQQDDIRSFIDDSMKRGAVLSTFRKEQIGGDSHGISYWYEDDPVVGHRLYREIRTVVAKRVKEKGSRVNPTAKYEWETVATNFDEFQDVSEKLFSSKSRTESSLGKKLKNDMLPEIEKVHKRKERLLKKQQREALLLDNFGTMDGLIAGRSLRDRKRVTYTFDDYDRSINEAIKITKEKQPSAEGNNIKGEGMTSCDTSANGAWHEPSNGSQENVSFRPLSLSDQDDVNEENESQHSLDRSNRRRRRPGRYSEEELIAAVSDDDDEGDSDYFNSDEEIVGEIVYDEEYMRKRKRKKKVCSSSEAEGDEEYKWSDENEEEGDDGEDEEESFSMSDEEDSDGHLHRKRFRNLPGRTRGKTETKVRSVADLQSGLRRSNRSTRNRINYQQYELSESDQESSKPKGPASRHESGSHSDASENEEYLIDSENEKEEVSSAEEMGEDEEARVDVPVAGEDGCRSAGEKEEGHMEPDESNSMNVVGVGRERHFLDLNEMAPGSGFDDGPSDTTKDEEEDNKGG